MRDSRLRQALAAGPLAPKQDSTLLVLREEGNKRWIDFLGRTEGKPAILRTLDLSNQRSDEYGGSADKRRRFPLEVFEACRRVWPAGKALGMRLSCVEWVEGGVSLEDTIETARQLKALGCDFKGKSSIALYAVAIGLAFVNAWIAVAMYFGVAIVWLVPDRRIERIIAGGADPKPER